MVLQRPVLTPLARLLVARPAGQSASLAHGARPLGDSGHSPRCCPGVRTTLVVTKKALFSTGGTTMSVTSQMRL